MRMVFDGLGHTKRSSWDHLAVAASVCAVLEVVLSVNVRAQVVPGQGMDAHGAPQYQVDAFWPKPLPNRWSMQQVTGIYVDHIDHVWFINRNRAAEPIEINGEPVAGRLMSARPRQASVTRSSGTQPRGYEEVLVSQGYQLKTRTTSQTLDMVRTCVDLAPFTEPALESFGLFYRERQKVWDGAAGICLARAAGGLFVGDGTGKERATVDIALDVAEPQFDSMLIASDPDATKIVTQRA